MHKSFSINFDDKHIINPEIMAILLGNIEVLLIMLLIYQMKHQKKFLRCLIMVLNMTIIL